MNILSQNTSLYARLDELLSGSFGRGSLAECGDAFPPRFDILRASHLRPPVGQAIQGVVGPIDPLSEAITYSNVDWKRPRHSEIYLDNLAHRFIRFFPNLSTFREMFLERHSSKVSDADEYIGLATSGNEGSSDLLSRCMPIETALAGVEGSLVSFTRAEGPILGQKVCSRRCGPDDTRSVRQADDNGLAPRGLKHRSPLFDALNGRSASFVPQAQAAQERMF